MGASPPRTIRPILLIHVQKTGGQSITSVLPGLGMNATAEPTDACSGVPTARRAQRHAKHAQAYAARPLYSDEEWEPHGHPISW